MEFDYIRSIIALKHDFHTDGEINAFLLGAEEQARDNQAALEKRDNMLRDAIVELEEAKKLLRAACDDFKELLPNILTCRYCAWRDDEGDRCGDHTVFHCEELCKWRHADEALDIIGSE